MRECYFLLFPTCQEQADLDGDQEKSLKLAQELEDLEERAQELDRRRTSNINSIRLVWKLEHFYFNLRLFCLEAILYVPQHSGN